MFQRAAGEHTVVGAVLDVMAELHEPDEAILAGIDGIFDPYRTPDRFVPFLARWVDLDRVLPPDVPPGEPVPFAPGYGCLRNLVATGAELAQWRGTSAGLRWFLRLATGVDGFTVVEDLVDRPFHIEVHVPPDAVPYRELVERIVAMEKPAFVTASVVVPDESAPAEVAPIEPTTGPTELVDAPTQPIPAVDPGAAGDPRDPREIERWTGSATASAWTPTTPSTTPPATPEGATS
jgi:phage tail-like protein